MYNTELNYRATGAMDIPQTERKTAQEQLRQIEAPARLSPELEAELQELVELVGPLAGPVPDPDYGQARNAYFGGVYTQHPRCRATVFHYAACRLRAEQNGENVVGLLSYAEQAANRLANERSARDLINRIKERL